LWRFRDAGAGYKLHTYLLRGRAVLARQHYSATVLCARTTVELLCYEMPDFIVAPKLWLSNIPHFSPVDYRIWLVLQGRICQQSVRDVDELRRHLMDSWSIMQQMGIDQVIDLYMAIEAEDMS